MFLVVTQFTNKMQLENFIHTFCPPISYCKLYNKGAFCYIFTLKKHVPFDSNSKKLNPKNET